MCVQVERGMPDGHTIKFEQEGDESPDYTSGDINFKLVTIPHKCDLRGSLVPTLSLTIVYRRFRRSKNDLLYTADITLREVALAEQAILVLCVSHEVVGSLRVFYGYQAP